MDELRTPEQVAALEPGTVIVNASGYAAVLEAGYGRRTFRLTRSDEAFDAEHVTNPGTRWFVLHRPGQVPAVPDADYAGRFDVHRRSMLVDIETGGPPETLAVFVKPEVAQRIADQLNAHEVAQLPAVRAWEQRYEDLQAEIRRQEVPRERDLRALQELRRAVVAASQEIFPDHTEVYRWRERLNSPPLGPISSHLQLLVAYIAHLRSQLQVSAGDEAFRNGSGTGEESA